jgi:hypothetical protein
LARINCQAGVSHAEKQSEKAETVASAGRPTGTAQAQELNDLARRLDKQAAAVELCAESVPAPASSDTGLTPEGRGILEAIERLTEGEREASDPERI